MALVPRLIPLAMALLLPAAAAAAPFTVTYEITGGEGFGRFNGSEIASGTIVVSSPNPASGDPPFYTASHSIYVHFATIPFGVEFTKTFRQTTFPVGTAFRGANKTLEANRHRNFCAFYTTFGCRRLGFERIQIRADEDGRIQPFVNWFFYATVTDVPDGFSFTGQEIASTPEPDGVPLGALAGTLAVGVAALSRLARKT